ncbi:MAG: hypothetical protein RLY17_1561 [Pseudomonadota bacterium]|jgi:hypothetical protein
MMLYDEVSYYFAAGGFSLLAVSKINQPDRIHTCGRLLPLVGGFRWMI